jgi:pentapeptide MXKDX repeat protein
MKNLKIIVAVFIAFFRLFRINESYDFNTQNMEQSQIRQRVNVIRTKVKEGLQEIGKSSLAVNDLMHNEEQVPFSNLLNQDPFDQDPFDQDPFSKDPFSKDPFSKDPFSKDPFDQDPFSKDPFSKDPFSKDPFSKDPFSKDPFSKDPFSKDPFDKGS